MNHQASESVSGFGSLSETAHKKHNIFKKSHTPDVHLPMDARIQEREVLKIRPPQRNKVSPLTPQSRA